MDAEHPNYNITTNATAPRTPLPFILPAFYISLLLVTIAFVLLTILAHKIAALKICQRKDEINLLPFDAWSNKTLDIKRMGNVRARTVRICGAKIANRYTLLSWRVAVWLYSLITLIVWNSDGWGFHCKVLIFSSKS